MGDININTLIMEQYIALIRDNNRSGVVKPEIGNDVNFEIKSHFIKELRHNHFAGIEDEDAHEHVRRVLEIAYFFHFTGVTHDAIMLRVFPITLTGASLRWKNMLPTGSITTWDLLEKAFIWRYCPPFKTPRKLEVIQNFKQGMDETLYQAWERYNDLLYRCSQHDLNSQQKVQIFYTGLGIPSRKMLDSQGFIPMMTPTQALKSIQWPLIYLNAQLSSYTSCHLEVSELAACLEKLHFPALLVMSKFSRICFSFDFKSELHHESSS
ncbi:ribonuclease H-like domain-containing protein [Tanacetum coccineum]